MAQPASGADVGGRTLFLVPVSRVRRHRSLVAFGGSGQMSIRTLIVIALITLGAMTFLFGCSKPRGPQPTQQVFRELSEEDSTRLERQRRVVATIAKQRYGTERLTKTKSDLPVLQRLLDDQVFAKMQSYELQCLGVAFGDVLATELPLRWMMVTDEIGTDPTLRYKNTTIQINALTMVSKRVEKGDAVDLATLLGKVPESIAQMEKELQK